MAFPPVRWWAVPVKSYSSAAWPPCRWAGPAGCDVLTLTRHRGQDEPVEADDPAYSLPVSTAAGHLLLCAQAGDLGLEAEAVREHPAPDRWGGTCSDGVVSLCSGRIVPATSPGP